VTAVDQDEALLLLLHATTMCRDSKNVQRVGQLVLCRSRMARIKPVDFV
jgi:hypothetical protein